MLLSDDGCDAEKESDSESVICGDWLGDAVTLGERLMVSFGENEKVKECVPSDTGSVTLCSLDFVSVFVIEVLNERDISCDNVSLTLFDKLL